MNAAAIAHKTIKAKADGFNLKFLHGLIKEGEAQRTVESIKAKETGNYDAVQDQNLVLAALVESATDRIPELDAAIDEWCENLDIDCTMAQFVIDWMDANL